MINSVVIRGKIEFQRSENQSLADCKKEVRWKVYIERFKIARVILRHIQTHRRLIKGMWNYRKNFIYKFVKPIKDLHILNGSCQIAKKICKSEITGVIDKLQKNEIIFHSRKSKKIAFDVCHNGSGKIPRTIAKAINDSDLIILEQAIIAKKSCEFRREYLRNSMAQRKSGQNNCSSSLEGLLSDGDVLGDGICAGLTMRFLKMVLDNPIIPLTVGLHEALY